MHDDVGEFVKRHTNAPPNLIKFCCPDPYHEPEQEDSNVGANQTSSLSLSEDTDSYSSTASISPVPVDNPLSFLSNPTSFQKWLSSCNHSNSALQTASLDNGNLSQEYRDRLWDPAQHILQIQDPDKLYSLRPFLQNRSIHLRVEVLDRRGLGYFSAMSRKQILKKYCAHDQC